MTGSDRWAFRKATLPRNEGAWLSAFLGGQMSSQITIQPRIPRAIYFPFRTLCMALDIPIERAIAALMEEALDRAGLSSKEAEKK